MANEANVTNNHVGNLTVGGVTIGPGRTAAVPNWPSVKRSGAVKVWLDQEILTADEPKAKLPAIPLPNVKTTKPTGDGSGLPGLTPAGGLPPPNDGLPPAGDGLPNPDPEAAEKTALIAKLHDAGIERTMRTSLDSLRKQVAEIGEK